MISNLKTFGARVTVQDLNTELSLEDRARKAGLYAVVDEHNRPKPTTGIIVSLGTDPLIQETFKVGDKVFFGKLAGQYIYHEGEQFRVLEIHEIMNYEPC